MASPREQNESVQKPKQPTPCLNNCGFFSNEACSGFCSKCYEEQLKRRSIEAKEENADKHLRPVPSTQLLSEENNTRPLTESRTPKEDPPRRNTPTRCYQCNKKVGLTGFTCKCGDVFCGKHRHADSHKCTFDHRSAKKELLAKQNPVVQAEKLHRL